MLGTAALVSVGSYLSAAGGTWAVPPVIGCKAARTAPVFARAFRPLHRDAAPGTLKDQHSRGLCNCYTYFVHAGPISVSIHLLEVRDIAAAELCVAGLVGNRAALNAIAAARTPAAACYFSRLIDAAPRSLRAALRACPARLRVCA